MTLPQLAELQAILGAEAAEVKAQLGAIGAELARRYGQEWQQIFVNQNKTHGDITLDRDGIKLKGTIGKKVVWDSTKLMALANELTWEETRRLFKIEFSVTETAFKDVENETLKARLVDARTVMYAPVQISIIQPKESPK
jgi:hypothetical protein